MTEYEKLMAIIRNSKFIPEDKKPKPIIKETENTVVDFLKGFYGNKNK